MSRAILEQLGEDLRLQQFKDFRNRDLQSLLYDQSPDTPEDQRRRSARMSRLLRMLRAHHLIQKVPRTHRYVLSPRGRDVISAILAAHRITLEQLNKLAA